MPKKWWQNVWEKLHFWYVPEKNVFQEKKQSKLTETSIWTWIHNQPTLMGSFLNFQDDPLKLKDLTNYSAKTTSSEDPSNIACRCTLKNLWHRLRPFQAQETHLEGFAEPEAYPINPTFGRTFNVCFPAVTRQGTPYPAHNLFCCSQILFAAMSSAQNPKGEIFKPESLTWRYATLSKFDSTSTGEKFYPYWTFNRGKPRITEYFPRKMNEKVKQCWTGTSDTIRPKRHKIAEIEGISILTASKDHKWSH